MLAIEELTEQISQLKTSSLMGRVEKSVGGLIESHGPVAQITELAELEDTSKSDKKILMEAIGFEGKRMQFMPYETLSDLKFGSRIRALGKPLTIPVGKDLLGRVINHIGKPLDYKLNIKGKDKPVFGKPADLLKRQLISEKVSTGVRSIDSLLTIGKGQRMGIFSGPGIGKSMLMAMLAKYSQADVNVIALVGERGREVKEFIENHLGPEGMRKSVIVVSTSEEPPIARIRNVYTATTIAEYFRDQGKDVFLMVDSITRLAQSQRELSIALKEPPVTRGYPPSLFNLLPKILERAGRGEVGSITGFYTVLVEGDDFDEPVSDAMRGLLDGHIVLSKKLAQRGHYPAIDIGQSISRVMIDIVEKEHWQAALKVKELISSYHEMEDLIQIGAYAAGSNPTLDEAISKKTMIDGFLKQNFEQSVPPEEGLQELLALVN